MDPHSQSFTPLGTINDNWRFHIEQTQADLAERVARIERRQDEDAHVRSVWSTNSAFPNVLSGTPQQAPLQQPAEPFRTFDDDATNMMSSLHLDAEEEPRSRSNLAVNSRANSVRFDETANQNYVMHSSRPSFDHISRSSSRLSGTQMNERTTSQRSDGRASSAHSIRSAASGRANSLNMDSNYGLVDNTRAPSDAPAFAPGLMHLGPVPAIIRCWMNTNFRHDGLLYAAVCSGSYSSIVDLRLIQNLGFDNVIHVNETGIRTIKLPVYFPEATAHPSVPRASPAPHVPSILIEFDVIEHVGAEDDNHSLQIFIGSDVLRTHSADILFSSNTITLYDADLTKLSIPMNRPEDERVFNSLWIVNGLNAPGATQPPKPEPAAKFLQYLNEGGQNSSTASVSSTTTSPPPGRYRPPGAVAAETGIESVKVGASTSGSDTDNRPPSQMSSIGTARPSLSLLNTRADTQDPATDGTPQASTTRSGNTPAVWSNWRRDGAGPAAANSSSPSGLDWAASRNREQTYQRKDTGIKVLKPKAASRTFSTSATASAGASSPAEGKSRFFDEGRRRSGPENGSPTNKPTAEPKKESGSNTSSATTATATSNRPKPNPIGGGSAFSWLNSGGAK